MRRKESGPIILAIDHNTALSGKSRERSRQWSAVNEELKKLSGIPRRVFVEGNWPTPYQPAINAGAHWQVVKYAKSHGWEVISLDRDWERLTPTYFDIGALVRNKQPSRYVKFNMREKDWARRAAQRKLSSTDIIVIHPGHVPGFLKESRIVNPQTVWIDPLEKNRFRQQVRLLDWLLFWTETKERWETSKGRLGPLEKWKFSRIRAKKRKERIRREVR